MPIMNGTKAPEFIYNTAFEENIALADKLKQAEHTYLIFLRYMGCTSCQVDILDYSEEYARFKEKNAQILLVLQSSKEVMASQTTAENPPFQIVCDPEMKLYELYEVKAGQSKEDLIDKNDEAGMAKLAKKREKAAAHGLTHGEYEGNEYQLPAVFLLDKEGTVVKAHYAKTITDMPDVDQMLALI